MDRLLSAPFPLHQPGCGGRACDPRECVEDVEKLVSSVIERHLGGGSKNGKGSLSGGGGWLSPDQTDSLTTFLIGEAWRESTKFDGRGRLAGFLVWRLHRRVIDWLRHEYVSTRRGAAVQFVEFNPDMHAASAPDEYEIDQERRLDRDRLSPRAGNQLALLELAIETDRTVGAIAAELHVPPSLAVLQREAVIIEQ